MSKKTVKIIFVIVFTLLFKLNVVNAKDAECVYSTISSKGSWILKIPSDTKKDITAKYKKNDEEIEVEMDGTSSDYRALINEDEYCPNEIHVTYNTSLDQSIFNIIHISGKVYYDHFKAEAAAKNNLLIINESARLVSGNGTKKNQENTFENLECTCIGEKNSKDKFYFKAIKGEKVEQQLYMNGNAQSSDLLNWNTDPVIFTGYPNKNYHAEYIYTESDEYKNNKCPSYAIVERNSKALRYEYNVYLSNSDKKGHITSFLKQKTFVDVYTLNCKKKEKNSNENPTTVPDPEPGTQHVDDPDVNMIITPLNLSMDTYSCGNGYLESIPATIPYVGKIVYLVVQILVPIIIILLGSFDLLKAVISQKDDDIKKNQQVFFKRLISAALIFFVFAIVKFVVSVVSSDNSGKIMDCVDCIIRNSNNCIRE